MNHIMAKGHVGTSSHSFSWVVIRVESVKDPLISSKDNRMIANVTSYEMVWATAHSAPMRAYLELDAHSFSCLRKGKECSRFDPKARGERWRLCEGLGWGRGEGEDVGVRSKESEKRSRDRRTCGNILQTRKNQYSFTTC